MTLEEIKEVIKQNYRNAPFGLFFTRNRTGDAMVILAKDDTHSVEICSHYKYLEVFGCTAKEKQSLEGFYNALAYYTQQGIF